LDETRLERVLERGAPEMLPYQLERLRLAVASSRRGSGETKIRA
jgi:hypothetical protein